MEHYLNNSKAILGYAHKNDQHNNYNDQYGYLPANSQNQPNHNPSESSKSRKKKLHSSLILQPRDNQNFGEVINMESSQDDFRLFRSNIETILPQKAKPLQTNSMICSVPEPKTPSPQYKEIIKLLPNYNHHAKAQKKQIRELLEYLVEEKYNEIIYWYYKFFETFEQQSELTNIWDSLKESYIGSFHDFQNQYMYQPKNELLNTLFLLYKDKMLNDWQKEYFPKWFEDVIMMCPEKAKKWCNIHFDSIGKHPLWKQIYYKHERLFHPISDAVDLDPNFFELMPWKQSEKDNLRFYKVIQNEPWERNKKDFRNLLILGETGSGKSSLINSMINYLHGVEFVDPYRLILIDDQKQNYQSQSQTTKITPYYITPKSSVFKQGICWIDTPGFGDTRGLGQDQQNAQKIAKYIIDSLPQVHGILFIVKATTTKLNIIQKYIVQQVLDLFGKEAKNNLFCWYTFADNGKPPAEVAIKEMNLPIKSFFKLNNYSILNSYTYQERELTKFYWKMGYDALKLFFKEIDRIPPLSLESTKKLIESKQGVIQMFEVIKDKINNYIELSYNLKVQINDFESRRQNEFRNSQVQMEKVTKILNYTQKALNCLTCNITCNFVSYKDSVNDINYFYFNNNKCKFCHCWYHMHKVEQNYIVEKPVSNNKYKSDLGNAKVVFPENIQWLKKEVDNLHYSIIQDINDIKHNLGTIKLKSWQKNNIDVYDYLRKLIDEEKANRREGYSKRIEIIKELIQKS